MKLLRKDINILPGKEGSRVFLVRDPRSGEIFEFGEFEYFFLTNIRKPYVESELLEKFGVHFRQQASSKDFHDFIASLDELGLLEEVSDTGNIEPELKIPLPLFETKPKPAVQSAVETEIAAIAQPRMEDASEPAAANTMPPGPHKFWFLFCPEKTLDNLIAWLYPFKWMLKLFPILLLIGGIGVLFNLQWVQHDLPKVSDQFKFLTHLVFTLFTINLGTLITKGVIARRNNLKTPSFGIILAYGLMPRFFLFIQMPQNLPKQVSVQMVASGLLTRLALFSLGSCVWLVTRSTATMLPEVSFALAFFSLISALFSVNPLINGDGYSLLCLYLNMPNLRQRANRALLGYFQKRPEAIVRHADDRLALKIYGLASITFILLLIGFIAFTVSTWLQLNYRGLGVSIFILLIVYLIMDYKRQLRSKKTPLKSKPTAQKTDNKDTNIFSGAKRKIQAVSLRRFLWTGLFVIVMLLPYPAEVGGDAEVLAFERREIYAEIPGIVEKVFFQGGEWVNRNEVLALMARHKQVKDVEYTKYSIVKEQEDVALLETTPLPEEVELALQQLNTAKVELQYSTDSAVRTEKLFNKGYSSRDEYEKAKEKMDIDAQEVTEAQASLLSIKNQVNTHQIGSGKAEVERLQQDLAYYQEQLKRQSLRSPIDGQIVTMNLKDIQNKYLDEGVLFAEIEDVRQARVTVSISEADIGEVAASDKVRLKIQAYPERIFEGTVTEIYPAAENTDYGAVVKVVSIIGNDKQLLKTGMTGYAKVEASEMPVIQAFTRALIRFFRIEVWSWIP